MIALSLNRSGMLYSSPRSLCNSGPSCRTQFCQATHQRRASHDGYASLAEDKQSELKKRKLKTLIILFGSKTDCDEFAPFGDVVQLEDVTK